MKYAGILVCGWLASAAVVAAEDRSPDQILVEIRAIQFPQLDDATRRDRGAVEELWGKLWRLKAELIKELYRVAPDHAEVPALMYERWRRGTPQDRSERIAEIDEVLAHTRSEVLRGHAFCRKAIELLVLRKRDGARSSPDAPDKVGAVIEAFIRLAPQDERGALLLYSYANELYDRQEKQSEIYKRIVAAYPESQQAKIVEGRKHKPEGIGKPFELEFTDSINGKHVSMKSLRGKVVVIDFWATWCGPCVDDIPRLKGLYAAYREKGVEFIGVSLDHPQAGGLERLKLFVAKNEVRWPQYYQGNGWDSAFSTSWGITGIPAVFVVDREGNLSSIDARDNLKAVIEGRLSPGK